jgi:UDP-glucose 4-epimerase
MRVVITGGAGFIGSHLGEQLLAAGHQVRVLDDLSTGSLRNIEGIRRHPAFRFQEMDVRDQGRVAEFLDAEDVDIIFHLAAGVGVRTILDEPLRSLETNLRGTENVLAWSARRGCRVLVASTSEVYGKNDAGPLAEDSDRTLGAGEVARWWYAVAKMADEALALAYHREQGLQAVVVRFFNTIGPRQSSQYGMVVPTLVHQAMRGEALTVYGDGEQTRCFTYVEDTVRALLALTALPEAYGHIYNIGQPAEISINGLARRILEITGSRSEVVHVPYREAYGDSYEDMRKRVPDCARLQRAIGWLPTDRLDEAITALVEEYRSREAPTYSGR